MCIEHLDEEFRGVVSDDYVLEVLFDLVDEMEGEYGFQMKAAKRDEDEGFLEPPKKRVKKNLISEAEGKEEIEDENEVFSFLNLECEKIKK